MNPGKNENVHIGKLDGVKQYEQKRYFLWSLRDILDILNGSGENVVNESFGIVAREKNCLEKAHIYKTPAICRMQAH